MLKTSPRPRGPNSLRTIGRQLAFEPLTPSFGAVPEDLAGRLYRIGPGRFEAGDLSAGGRRFRHWFDGDGLISAVDFEGGAVRFATRLVEPDGHDAPGYAGRGRFGLPPQGVLRRIRSLHDPSVYVNAANTALMDWGERLFALYEGDRPTEIDPDSLATLGATSLGCIRRAFSAHPKKHRPSGAWINQGFRPPPRPQLDYYALEADGAARHIGAAPFRGTVLTHDFAVTDKYIISICSPLFADFPAILFLGRSVAEATHWRPEKGTEIIVTPVGGGAPVARVIAEPLLYTHTATAWDEGDGEGAEIVIQGVMAEDGAGFFWIGSVREGAESLAPSSPARLSELRIRVSDGRVRRRTLYEGAIDFPIVDERIAPGAHRFVYAAGFRDRSAEYHDLLDVLLKIDTVSGTAQQLDFGAGHYVSEALFAARPGGGGEDDGWLLALNYDATKDESYAAIVDATRMETVALLPVGQPLPMSFHGLWRGR